MVLRVLGDCYKRVIGHDPQVEKHCARVSNSCETFLSVSNDPETHYIARLQVDTGIPQAGG